MLGGSRTRLAHLGESRATSVYTEETRAESACKPASQRRDCIEWASIQVLSALANKNNFGMEISDKPASPKTLEAHKPAALVRIRPIPGDTTPFAESTRKNIFAYSNQKGCQHALTHSSKPLLATTSQSIIRRRSTFSPFDTP